MSILNSKMPRIRRSGDATGRHDGRRRRRITCASRLPIVTGLAVLAVLVGLVGLVGLLGLGSLDVGAPAQAGDRVLNLYTSRHYQTDEALYQAFTEETGIEVNRLEGKDDALIERVRSEGANSPADILITVDAGRLWRAEQAGLFQEVASPLLESRVPAHLRHPEGRWFGFSQRARLIFYNKNLVPEGAIASYEDLADPKWRGLALIAASGEAAAEAWARGVVANFARPPQGGDTDQIRATAVGECGIAVANSYYFARLLGSAKAADREAAEGLGVVFPNQDGRGTHINISGGGVLKHARHKAAAIRFLEFLASETAQRIFADGNNEYPVVTSLAPAPVLAGLGEFKRDTLEVSQLGVNQAAAQRLFDRVGWK
jgi:iron(III) transport system substrate-binding protein